MIGERVKLTAPVPGFEIIGGSDQAAISPWNLILAADGGTHDLLLTFELPVTQVSIVSDRYPETPDVIRLMILEPVGADDVDGSSNPNEASARVLAVDEKLDDQVRAPGNILTVHLKGKPFQHVLIECTTEPEAFDNLRFTRDGARQSAELKRDSRMFDWAKLMNQNGN